MALQSLMIECLWIVAVLMQGLKGLPKRDCQDIKDDGFNTSGVYHVTPLGTCTGFDVYCDLTTDGGGWLVFQRRRDGSVDFYRNWNEYVRGFGNKTGEHWLGNLALHAITSHGFYEMRVHLADWEGNTRYAMYRTFRVEHTERAYRLIIAGYSGDAGDSLTHHNGQTFTTKDRDNDRDEQGNCAALYQGGWWYTRCHLSNLNGVYLSGVHRSYANGINWRTWRGLHYSLKETEMKIRRI